MNIELKKQVQAEMQERKQGAYSKLIEANCNLADKLKWLKEDIEREIYKLETLDIDFTKEVIINDLKKILKNNN